MSRLAALLPFLWLVLLTDDSEKRPPAKPLFDGKTFAGWDGDMQRTWRIEDGCLVGGSLKDKIPRNEFLATTASYSNFILKLKFKLLGDTTKGFVNSGVQFRSQRDPRSSEMIGYQADLGDPTWWGCIYDESRRNKVMAQSDMKAIEKVLKRGDWNDYEIRAEGKRMRTFINGALAVDYTEADDAITQTGRIGLQIHGGGPAEVWFKDLMLEELPSTKLPCPGAPEPPLPPGKSPLSPEEEKKTFSLPPGFEIELVACEPAAGKPITVAWDHAARLWTMTALEYPLDANENPERSKELFTKGGRDRVLVFDNPYPAGPHTPRTFAEGLAIPLGMMPYKDGCFVQYGNQILRLRDRQGAGRSDTREVFLQDFGTEDSHLFPHQFTRGPGGWLYFAQGAFNHSKVRTKEGPSVRMSYCKMARVKLDGTGFELVESGLNNIWGFVISPTGEMYIQEANDLGYPVVPFEIGANFPGIGMEKLKPYAPWTPTVPHSFQVGGTGLSGLAQIQSPNFGRHFPHNGPVFFAANPITRKIQTLWIEPTPQGDRLVLLPDFVLSSDPWFRPVSIHFGPDECLYIVDWYNAIISHNEVPRNHPDRDKTRGRIWRVRRTDQKRAVPEDLTKVNGDRLVALLGSSNAWLRKAAWEEIVDRKATDLSPKLEAIAENNGRPLTERLAALWALEGLHDIKMRTLDLLLKSADASVRREAVRVLGTEGSRQCGQDGVCRRCESLADDASPSVRAAAIRALCLLKEPGPDPIMAILRFVKPESTGPSEQLQQGGTAKTGAAHDRDFERYLVRSMLEQHDELVLILSLTGDRLPIETRCFAALALPAPHSAELLADLLPRLERLPNEEELILIANHADAPRMQQLLQPLLRRNGVLKQLLEQRSRFDNKKIRTHLIEPARRLWPDDVNMDLVARLVAAFQLKELESDLAASCDHGVAPARQLLAVRALREIGSQRADLFAQVITANPSGSALKEEAALALAGCASGPGSLAALKLLPDFNARERQLFLDRLANSPSGAQTVIEAFQKGLVAEEHLEAALVEKLQLVLRNDAKLSEFLKTQARFLRTVLLLDGNKASYVDYPITLEGPFTVECWVRLAPGISNADSLLGRPNIADFNFHDARLRLWGGPGLGDLIIAKKPITPEAWTHVAISRDAQGKFALYLNGELDTSECRPSQAIWKGLEIGHSNPGRGTRAAFDEFRLWERARTADEIRSTFDQSLAGQARTDGLALVFGGESWGKLHGNAQVSRTTDFPPLLDPVQAKALAEKFTLYRNMVQQGGDRARGLAVFDKNCRGCHTAEGRGGQVGPTLNGVGATSDDAMLRNLLTPSAAIEPGYRLFRVELQSGIIKDGFLVRRSDTEVVLRRPNEQDETIDARKITFAGFTKRSVMPDGLLDALKPEETRDLFSYLRSLK